MTTGMTTTENNSNNADNLLRQAYLDEQLSVEEVINFEKGLSKEDKAGIAAERVLMSALADKLKEGAGCPDALWSNIKTSIEAEKRVLRPRASVWSPISVAGLAASVACIVTLGVVFGLGLNRGQIPETITENYPPFIVRYTPSLDEFKAQANYQFSGSFEEIQGALKAHGFNVALAKPSNGSHHPVDFYGLKVTGQGDARVAQLLFSCCGKPVSVLVMPKGRKLNTLEVKGLVNERRSVKHLSNGYALVGLSDHRPDDAMDFLSPRL